MADTEDPLHPSYYSISSNDLHGLLDTCLYVHGDHAEQNKSNEWETESLKHNGVNLPTDYMEELSSDHAWNVSNYLALEESNFCYQMALINDEDLWMDSDTLSMQNVLVDNQPGVNHVVGANATSVGSDHSYSISYTNKLKDLEPFDEVDMTPDDIDIEDENPFFNLTTKLNDHHPMLDMDQQPSESVEANLSSDKLLMSPIKNEKLIDDIFPTYRKQIIITDDLNQILDQDTNVEGLHHIKHEPLLEEDFEESFIKKPETLPIISQNHFACKRLSVKSCNKPDNFQIFSKIESKENEQNFLYHESLCDGPASPVSISEVLSTTSTCSSSGSEWDHLNYGSSKQRLYSSRQIKQSQTLSKNNFKVFTASNSLAEGGGASRRPIRTSLISNQPKGAIGVLQLTEEEKRTLILEGYPVPKKLPLNKIEEKYLKKIRRKIKNKISAQESRRKKKEYMDCLERRMYDINNNLNFYKQRCVLLETQNLSLLEQMRKLQNQIQQNSANTKSNSESIAQCSPVSVENFKSIIMKSKTPIIRMALKKKL